jgi:hypothetical protein
LIQKMTNGAMQLPTGMYVHSARIWLRCILELVAIVSFIVDQGFGIRRRWIDQLCTDLIAKLAFTQPHNQRPSNAVTRSMKPGVVAAFRSTDMLAKPSLAIES